MKRKKKARMTPEERAAWEARAQETLRKLQERIAYHEAKLAGRASRRRRRVLTSSLAPELKLVPGRHGREL
jgi:hypothetical protein